MAVKKCNRCDATLPVSEFYRNNTYRDGLQRQCKRCHSSAAKARYLLTRVANGYRGSCDRKCVYCGSEFLASRPDGTERYCSLWCRLISKVDVRGTNDCWGWASKAKSGFGYGIINVGGKHTSAHRAMWTLCRGSIPDGMHVLHRCDNPKCVNPSHLFLGTHQDNMADMNAKGRNGTLGKTYVPQTEYRVRRNAQQRARTKRLREQGLKP